MEGNTHQEAVQRIAHELAIMGQKSEISLTEKQISVLTYQKLLNQMILPFLILTHRPLLISIQQKL